MTAVNRGPNGGFVFVVGSDKKVSLHPINMGWTQGDTVVIKSGVKPGDVVVTDGQMILKAGSLVRIAACAKADQPVNLASPFIHRPVATTLLAVGLLLVGVVGYSLLPVASLPNVDFPTLQVSASLPGANPETMASNVATPLERQFSLIPGITQMTSVNALGSTSITLQFELSRESSPTISSRSRRRSTPPAPSCRPTFPPSPPSARSIRRMRRS